MTQAGIAPRVVSIDRAAELTGVCRRTIYHWMEQGRIEFIRTAGGSPRILEASLWRTADREMLQDGVAE